MTSVPRISSWGSVFRTPPLLQQTPGTLWDGHGSCPSPLTVSSLRKSETSPLGFGDTPTILSERQVHKIKGTYSSWAAIWNRLLGSIVHHLKAQSLNFIPTIKSGQCAIMGATQRIEAVFKRVKCSHDVFYALQYIRGSLEVAASASYLYGRASNWRSTSGVWRSSASCIVQRWYKTSLYYIIWLYTGLCRQPKKERHISKACNERSHSWYGKPIVAKHKLIPRLKW